MLALQLPPSWLVLTVFKGNSLSIQGVSEQALRQAQDEGVVLSPIMVSLPDYEWN